MERERAQASRTGGEGEARDWGGNKKGVGAGRAVININKAARPIFDQSLSTKASALGERDMEELHNARKFGDDKNIVSKNAIGVRESAESGEEAGGPIYVSSKGHLINVGDL